MGRLTGQTLCRPVVYGSIAFFLGKRATEGNSHKWSIYVRGLEDEDLSSFVKRVVFTLHPSCAVPVVTCEAPPYVVTQTGWGEFDVKVTMVFRDEEESSVDMIHTLKLYPPGGSTTNVAVLKKPVVSERYEELVFHAPSDAFGAMLAAYDKATTRKDVSPEELRACFTKVSEVDDMKSIVAAQAFITQELDRACSKLTHTKAQLTQLTNAKDAEKRKAAAAAEAKSAAAAKAKGKGKGKGKATAPVPVPVAAAPGVVKPAAPAAPASAAAAAPALSAVRPVAAAVAPAVAPAAAPTAPAVQAAPLPRPP